MKEVAACRRGSRVAASHALGPERRVQFAGRARTAHPGGNPVRLEGIAVNLGPAPGNSASEQRVVQLVVCIGLKAAPRSSLSVQVGQTCIATPVQLGADIDQALRPVDQRGQSIGRERIDRVDTGQTVLCVHAAA